MPKTITHGIILSAIKYGESSLIVTAYTLEHGRQAYIVSVSASAKKLRQVLMTPLSIVEIEASDCKNSTMKRLSSVNLEYVFRSVPFDVSKRSIAIFLAELFQQATLEATPDERTYSFLRQSIEVLDQGVEGLANFHLLIMFNLARLLGFAPDTGDSRLPYFDMVDGAYRELHPMHPNVLSGGELSLWRKLCLVKVDTLSEMLLSADDRQILFDLLEKYYALHIPQFRPLNSRLVLKDVLR